MNNKISKKEKLKSKKLPIIGETKEGYPIIQCEFRDDFFRGLMFYCPYCKRYHLHGRGEGHRSGHCSNKNSPICNLDYVLKSPEVKM